MQREKDKADTVRLALSTGDLLTGSSLGRVQEDQISTGEVVFNTSMCGYQESLTDPSYMGQILVQTQPLIGNTGVNPVDIESSQIQVSGFVVHEYTQKHSNYRADQSLAEYLSDAGILGLHNVDTRKLTMILREHPSVQGVLTNRQDLTDTELVEMARSAQSMSGQNLAQKAGSSQTSPWSSSSNQWGIQSPISAESPKVLLMDFGFKSNIARCLTDVGCQVELIPSTITSYDIKDRVHSHTADALFLSNGPGDPAAVTGVIDMLKSLLQDEELSEFPIFGICLGHQLLSLALGATTYKLPFGHRGANHPVHDLQRNRIQITSQNHGFAVDRQSLEDLGGIISHIHLNDGSVAGFRLSNRPLAAVQFHPEASPGPHDTHQFFYDVIDLIKSTNLSKSQR